MLDKLKELLNKMNKLGIPTPLMRDPKYGVASVSLTMMYTSFVICVVGLIGKASGYLGGIDMSQALTLLGITSSLYFGRQFNTKSGDVSAAVSTDQETK